MCFKCEMLGVYFGPKKQWVLHSLGGYHYSMGGLLRPPCGTRHTEVLGKNFLLTVNPAASVAPVWPRYASPTEYRHRHIPFLDTHLNSGVPQTTHAYVPSSLWSVNSPTKGLWRRRGNKEVILSVRGKGGVRDEDQPGFDSPWYSQTSRASPLNKPTSQCQPLGWRGTGWVWDGAGAPAGGTPGDSYSCLCASLGQVRATGGEHHGGRKPETDTTAFTSGWHSPESRETAFISKDSEWNTLTLAELSASESLGSHSHFSSSEDDSSQLGLTFRYTSNKRRSQYLGEQLRDWGDEYEAARSLCSTWAKPGRPESSGVSTMQPSVLQHSVRHKAGTWKRKRGNALCVDAPLWLDCWKGNASKAALHASWI